MRRHSRALRLRMLWRQNRVESRKLITRQESWATLGCVAVPLLIVAWVAPRYYDVFSYAVALAVLLGFMTLIYRRSRSR